MEREELERAFFDEVAATFRYPSGVRPAHLTRSAEDGAAPLWLTLDVADRAAVRLDVTAHLARYVRGVTGAAPMNEFRRAFADDLDALVVSAAALCLDVRSGRRPPHHLRSALRIAVVAVVEEATRSQDRTVRAVGAGLVARLAVACTSGALDPVDAALLERARLPVEDAWQAAVQDAFDASPDWQTTPDGHARLSALPSREGLVLGVLARSRLTGERFLVQLGPRGFEAIEGAAVTALTPAARALLRSAPGAVASSSPSPSTVGELALPDVSEMHAIVFGRLHRVRFRMRSRVRTEEGELVFDDTVDDVAGDLARLFPRPSPFARLRARLFRPLAALLWRRRAGHRTPS